MARRAKTTPSMSTNAATPSPASARVNAAIRQPTPAPLDVAAPPAGARQAAMSVREPALAKPPTKLSQVLAALRSPEGSNLAALGQLTGWQPHSIRAALSGLRKAGHDVGTPVTGGSGQPRTSRQTTQRP